MPHDSLKQTKHSHILLRLQLVAVLLFLFWLLAYGTIIYPKYFHFGFLGLCLAGVLFLLGPFVGFFLYFPTTFFLLGIPLPGLPFSLNQVIGVLFVLSWLNWFFRGRVQFPRGWLVFWMTVLFIYFIINALAAEDFKEGVNHLRYLAIYFFIALALASILQRKKNYHTIFVIIMLFTMASAFLGAFELTTGMDILTKSESKWMGRIRINGAAPNSIVYAYQLLFAFPFGYYLFCESKSFGGRFLALGCSIFLTIIALFTFNRQTILLVSLTYILAAVLFKNRYSKIFLFLVITLGLLLSPVIINQIWKRLQTISSLGRDRSLALRIDGIKVGREIIRRHPLMGIGLGAYSKVWSKYIPMGKTRTIHYYKSEKRYPDMGYNQLLCEGGLIGFFLGVSFYFLLLFYLLRARKAALISGQRDVTNIFNALLMWHIIFLLSSAIQDTFLYVSTWIMFGIILSTLGIDFSGGEGKERDVSDSAVALPQGAS
jgi:O-antigen ligase